MIAVPLLTNRQFLIFPALGMLRNGRGLLTTQSELPSVEKAVFDKLRIQAQTTHPTGRFPRTVNSGASRSWS